MQARTVSLHLVFPTILLIILSVCRFIIMPSPSQIMTTAEILDRLRQATVDLLWLSESDYPFEVIAWERGVEITPTALVKELTQPDLQVETIELAAFFEPALAVADWYAAEELAQVDRYQELLHAIEANLTDVRVFRVGEIEIAIYIVGKTPAGDVVGLKTHVVET
jgi:hypothetical protein